MRMRAIPGEIVDIAPESKHFQMWGRHPEPAFAHITRRFEYQKHLREQQRISAFRIEQERRRVRAARNMKQMRMLEAVGF